MRGTESYRQLSLADRLKVDEQIDELKTTDPDLNDYIENLELEIKDLRESHDSLSSEYDELKRELDGLREDYDSLDSEKEDLECKYNNLQDDYDDLTNNGVYAEAAFDFLSYLIQEQNYTTRSYDTLEKVLDKAEFVLRYGEFR